jgi:hypothetical protein
MTYWFKLLSFYLWIAPHLLLVLVAVLLWKRRLHIEFPAFALYVWYEITEFIVLFTISGTGFQQQLWYYRLFLITLAMSAVLRFGVIQEIFNNIFREQGKVNSLARVSLRWTTGVLLLGVVLFSIFASGEIPHGVLAGAAWVSRGIAIIQCCLVLFMFLFSRLLGLSLQNYVFGIALGFGILSSVELASSAMRIGDLSESTARALNLLTTGGYHIAVLIWLGYLFAPARVIVQPRELPAGELHHWNTELERFLQ